MWAKYPFSDPMLFLRIHHTHSEKIFWANPPMYPKWPEPRISPKTSWDEVF